MSPLESPAPDGVPDLGLEAIGESAEIVVNPTIAATVAAERQWLENERLRAQVADLAQDRQERKKYAERIFWLLVGWLSIVMALVLATGLSIPKLQPYVRFELAQAVILMLIGTTTASVVGIFLIVASYLFPKR